MSKRRLSPQEIRESGIWEKCLEVVEDSKRKMRKLFPDEIIVFELRDESYAIRLYVDGEPSTRFSCVEDGEYLELELNNPDNNVN